jgi:tetratricopeptide (TPR) repeat protein
MSANIGRAKSAALVGDVEGVIASLRRARERGYNRFQQLEADPAWASVRDHPEFRALVHEIAGGWIEDARHTANPTQIELRGVGHAHIARGEYAQALEVLERALEMGGPRDAEIRAELAALRSAIESGTPERARLRVNAGR